MTTKTEISAADIARKHGVVPRIARMALRAAGFKAPYAAKDLAKITATIKAAKPKAATAKPSKAKAKASAEATSP
jgi:hypothetical protein